VGLGTTGATTAGPVATHSDGIDYAGRWRVQLALGAPDGASCADHLPDERTFEARLTLQVTDTTPATPSPPATPSTPEVAGGDAAGPGTGEPPAAQKYRTPAQPSAPVWAYPVLGVATTLGLGAAAIMVRLGVRRRRRGW
jgi:hypothetical protein